MKKFNSYYSKITCIAEYICGMESARAQYENGVKGNTEYSSNMNINNML